MGRLTDILNGGAGNFDDIWNSTAAAGEFGPVPRGTYICHATKGELEKSRTKHTPGYKIVFTVIEGEFTDRRIWLDLWLTPAALASAKRDLLKLGITTPQQMELPLPRGIRCKVIVALRRDDDGIERNKVHGFEVLGIDKQEPDAFAPTDTGDAAEPEGEVDTSFDPHS